MYLEEVPISVSDSLDSILKSRDFASKGLSNRSYGFSSGHVWMWELDYRERWVLKNWCFWTVVLEKTLESSLDARGSNQSILKEISPEYSLEEQMLKLKLQHSGHQMQRIDSFEKTLMLGKIEGWRRRRWHPGWMASPTQWTWVWVNSGSWRWTGRPGVLRFRGRKESDTTEWLNWTNWTDLPILASLHSVLFCVFLTEVTSI